MIRRIVLKLARNAGRAALLPALRAGLPALLGVLLIVGCAGKKKDDKEGRQTGTKRRQQGSAARVASEHYDDATDHGATLSGADGPGRAAPRLARRHASR